MNQRGPERDPVERSSLPWISLGLTLVLLLGMTVIAIRDWSYRPRGAVSALVPVDGHRVAVQPSGPDPGRVWENATAVGNPGLGLVAGPLIRQIRELGQAGPGPFQLWWRSTLVTGPDAALTRLLVVRNDALRLQLVDTDDGSTVYAPGLPLLPAAATDEEEWEQTGEAVDGEGQRQPYTVSGRLVATDDPAYADRECRSVRLTLTLGSQRPGTERYVLCPGSGLVDVLPADAVRPSGGDYRPPDVPVAPTPGAASDPRTWTASTALTTTAISARDMAVTAGDRLVGSVHAESDLIGWRRTAAEDGDGEGWTQAWLRRPGGRLLTVRTSGRTVLVTTDQRAVVAYDETGRWLWSQSTSEISRAGVTPLTGGRFVVALLDGGVQLRRASDGALVSEDRLPGGILAPAAAAPTGGFYVADDSGTLRAYGPDGATQWQQRIPLGRVTLQATAEGVAVRTAGRLGHLVAGGWTWRLSTDVGPAVLAGDLLVAGTTSELLGIRVADGGIAWRRPDLSPGYVATVNPIAVLGDGVVVVDGARLLVVDRTGADVAEHALPSTAGLQVDVTPADGSRGITAWSSIRADVTVWGPGADV